MAKLKKNYSAASAKSDTPNMYSQINKEVWDKAFPGYPIYPPSDDIFSRGKEVRALNPEHLGASKEPNTLPIGYIEKTFGESMDGSDLDVPGAELDDDQEDVGSEDEENNYYSIGGDNHNDLDEDNG